MNDIVNISRTFKVNYGLLSLFTSMLHNLFLLYHVHTFVSIYKIGGIYFWIGETIFMIWNSVNDPLFGWMTDRKALSINGNSKSSSHNLTSHRLYLLSIVGPLFALSFLTIWFPWGSNNNQIFISLQLVVCLCLYDTFLTVIDLQHSALLADLCINIKTRTSLSSYTTVGNAAGSFSVFLSYSIWSPNELNSHFKLYCITLSLCSLFGFYFCSKSMLCDFKLQKKFVSIPTSEKNYCHTNSLDTQTTDIKHMKRYFRSLINHKNFCWFSCMNLLQVFHCHFNNNFFPFFLLTLLKNSLTSQSCSIVLGISFIAPHINNLYFLTLCRKFGAYSVIKYLFIVKVFSAILIFQCGLNYISLLCIFLACNRIFTEGVCKLLNLVISDLIDEDFVIYNRTQTISALMFGTISFISKPGQTLAPLIGTWLINIFTGKSIFDRSYDQTTDPNYQLQLFKLLVFMPICCGILQLMFWSQFTLFGQRLSYIKSVRYGGKAGLFIV